MKKILLLFAVLVAPALSQTWTGVLDPNRAIDWSTAGAGIIPARTTICASFTSTATAAQINAAIANVATCPAGSVVSLAAGSYTLTSILIQRDNVTFRGAGPSQTILNITGTNNCGGITARICVPANVLTSADPGNEGTIVNWTAGYAKGTSQITLASVAGLQVGSVMMLDQTNDTNTDTNSIWIGTTVNVHCLDCASPSRANRTRLEIQSVTVTGIAGNVVTIDPPIAWPNFVTGKNPQAWYPANGHAVTGVGIEDMRITGPDTGAAVAQTITFYNASKNWVKNVQAFHVGEKGVRLYQSNHITVRDSYFWDKQGPDSGQEGSESYGIDSYIGSMNLIENNIFHHITSPLQCENGIGNVYAYNYSFDDFYNLTNSDWGQASDYTHGVCAYLLREGNNGFGFISDIVHSSNYFQSVFRNRYEGIDVAHLPNLALQTVPIHIYAANRFHNIVGNVLGTTSYHTKYESLATGGSANCDTSIFAIGFGGNCSNSGGVVSKADTATTTMRWGNWDTVTSTNDTGTNDATGTRFNTTEDGHTASFFPALTGASTALPNSFYLSSKPSFFGTNPWPAIGPDISSGNIASVGGHAFKNPARLCYEGGTHDAAGVRTDFDAAVCFPTGAASPSVSLNPTSLNFANTLVGATNAEQSSTLTNNGTAALTISSISVTGVDFMAGSTSNSCPLSPSTLAAGSQCIVYARFSPQSAGAKVGSISIVSDAPGSPHSVSLSGTGVAPTPTAVLSAASIPFGNQTVGVTSGSQTISLSNTGTATLAIASIVVNGDFARTTTCGATLGVGLSCNISVTFTPTVAGIRNGTLTVTDNSGGVAGSTQTASLSGTGISAFKTYALGRVGSGRSFAFGRTANLVFSYSARTDNCVVGTESGCIAGATTGKAGSVMSFRSRPTDANLFSNNAPANTAATDPDFNSYIVLATDQNTSGPGSSFNMGSNGGYDAFSKDSSMLLVAKNGGATWVFKVDIAAIHAKTCTTGTPCLIQSQITTGAPDCSSGTLGTGCTHLLQQGDWTFSRESGGANVLLEEDPNLSKIYKLTIDKSLAPSAWTFRRDVYVDFAADLPVACKVMPTTYTVGWSGVFNSGNDGSITKAYGGGIPWPGSGQVVSSTETFIYPVVNNPGHRGFQATTAGTLGSSEPLWNLNCNTTDSTCLDGTVVWTNIGNLNTQGPGFDVVNFRPGKGCSRLNTRTGRVTRGTGNVEPSGLLTTQDDSVCSRMTGTTCDPNGNVISNLTDRWTLHEASQPFDSRYVGMSPTGAGAVETGTVSGSSSCSLPSANNRGLWSAVTTYVKNDLTYLNQVIYVSDTTNTNSQPDINPTDWHLGDALCYSYVWQVASTVVNPCIENGAIAGVGACGGHSEAGYSVFYKGTLLRSHFLDRPSRGGLANPGNIILPRAIGSADHHGSGRNEDSTDTLPLAFFTTEVPTSSTRYDTAGYAEDIALVPDGTQRMFRFNHNYNTGSSAEFGVQNAIGVISQDGQFAAMVSDWMGTRGSRITGGTVCNKLRADDGPVKNASITTGFQILPVINNTGQDIYQAQNNGTTDKTTTPNWNNSCPNVNDVCTDGVTTPVDTAVRWKNLGPNDCRGDIAVIDLLSAHPLP